MPSIGPLELAVILVIVLLIFGPKRLPGLGRQLGAGMREFKDSISGRDKDEDDDRDAFGRTRELAAAEPVEPAAEAQQAPEPVAAEARPDQARPPADA